jgi:hypothetical protein
MSQTQTAPQTDTRRPLRAWRHAAGIVAQYIQELSDAGKEPAAADAVAAACKA